MSPARKDDIGESTAEDWADESQWIKVVEDEGYKIDWDTLPLLSATSQDRVFFGTFKGVKVVQGESLANPGEKSDVDMLLFTDRTGERCNAFANYRLAEALKEGMTTGKRVKIVWHGKEKIKNDSQEVNRMSVYVAD